MKKTKAFTLIELLIVVVIIGILATFVVITLKNARTKAIDAKAKDSVQKVAESLEQYKAINDTQLKDIAAICGGTTGCSEDVITGILQAKGVSYPQTTPQDAVGGTVMLQVPNTSPYGAYKVWGTASDGTSIWCINGLKDGGYNLGTNGTAGTSCQAS
jgi:prepilin-type N-terminal cleavage/methylation domain-containing protein